MAGAGEGNRTLVCSLGSSASVEENQEHSCKTRAIRPKSSQRVTAKKQNGSFEPLEHAVYIGRQKLGRYSRVGVRRYAAYDARNRLIGRFRKRADALAAIGNGDAGAAQ